ncbi:MAG TPA: hypothetical protein VG826_17665 [Pirellulales bacterium]|nr:hypothetical protein [Pirellulales bacterium]
MHRIALLVLLTIATLVAGCGPKAQVKDYIPPEEAARQALTTALDAWKAGKAPDQVGASNPAVQAQDVQWSGGQKLTAYEIVGPAPTAEDQNQRFTVKLTLGGGPPTETTYVVVGKDPIWVFSAESYQKTSGM